ncbi:MAG: hypothetical protein RIE56_03520 [Amphiplicatus sp.]
MAATVRFIVCLAFITIAPAQAQPSDTAKQTALCVNPDKDYAARVIGSTDIAVKNTLGGKEQPTLRLTTSCAGLDAIDRITLSSAFTCVGKGDALVATSANGSRRVCTITAVSRHILHEESETSQ